MEWGPARWRKVSDAVAGFLRADGKLAPIYAVETKFRPDRCPDCGKQEYKEMPSPRLATEEEIQELLRAKSEKWD